MLRRVFLQILGLTGAVTSSGRERFLFQKEAPPPPDLGVKHLVVDRAQYIGSFFDGEFWNKGNHASLTLEHLRTRRPYKYTIFSGLKGFKTSIKVETSTNGFQDVEEPLPIAVYDTTDVTQALQHFRTEVGKECQALLEAAPSLEKVGDPTVPLSPLKKTPVDIQDITVVTTQREPLKILVQDGQTQVIGFPLEHYLVKGTVEPNLTWSDCGRLPLEMEFESHKELLKLRGAQFGDDIA